MSSNLNFWKYFTIIFILWQITLTINEKYDLNISETHTTKMTNKMFKLYCTSYVERFSMWKLLRIFKNNITYFLKQFFFFLFKITYKKTRRQGKSRLFDDHP